MSLTYLASPYSDPDPNVRYDRFAKVAVVAGKLMKRGEHIFSPIPHSHSIEQFMESPQEARFWMEQDLAVLRYCSKLKVLTLPGWDVSNGVTEEIAKAKSWDIPMEYINYRDIVHYRGL